MNKMVSRIIGSTMMFGAVGFLVFALTHPEASLPYDLKTTYAIYATYLATGVFFLVAPFKEY